MEKNLLTFKISNFIFFRFLVFFNALKIQLWFLLKDGLGEQLHT